jgi:hypothetical protein
MHCPQVIITYLPGAATPGGFLRLPSFFGVTTRVPERWCIQTSAATSFRLARGISGPGIGVASANLAREEGCLRVARRIQPALQVPGVDQRPNTSIWPGCTDG